MTLDKLATSLYWKPILRTAPAAPSDEATLFAVDPLRKFFAPELLTIADVALTLRGDLLSFSRPPPGGGGASSSREASAGFQEGWGEAGRGEDSGITPPWEAGKLKVEPDDGAAPRSDAFGGDASGQSDWGLKPPPPSPDPGPFPREAVPGACPIR